MNIEKFYVENFDKLCKSISFRAGGLSNAEDIVQEAFARAIAYLKTGGEIRNEEKWFRGIVYNCMMDFLREDSKMGMSLDDEEEEIEFQQATAEVKAKVKDLKAFSKTLSERDSKVFSLVFEKGYSAKEICDYVEVKPHYVRRLIYEIRKKINKEMGE